MPAASTAPLADAVRGRSDLERGSAGAERGVEGAAAAAANGDDAIAADCKDGLLLPKTSSISNGSTIERRCMSVVGPDSLPLVPVPSGVSGRGAGWCFERRLAAVFLTGEDRGEALGGAERGGAVERCGIEEDEAGLLPV